MPSRGPQRIFDYEAAAQMRRDGATGKEIAAAMGVSLAAVNRVMRVYFRDVVRGTRPVAAAILKLHELGDKPSVIGHKLGLPAYTVRSRLHSAGIPMRVKKTPSPKGPDRRLGEKAPRRRAARILAQAGLSYQEIGTAFGVSRQRAQQLVRPTETELEKFRQEHGNKCDKCGTTSGKLNAHHTDYSTGPTQLLCVPCHRGEHSHVAEYLSQEKA